MYSPSQQTSDPVSTLKSSKSKLPISRVSPGGVLLPPLVMHVVYRFDVGGLENGVVNLINHMPAQSYRHAVLSLTEVTDFSQRFSVAMVDADLSGHDPIGSTRLFSVSEAEADGYADEMTFEGDGIKVVVHLAWSD